MSPKTYSNNLFSRIIGQHGREVVNGLKAWDFTIKS